MADFKDCPKCGGKYLGWSCPKCDRDRIIAKYDWPEEKKKRFLAEPYSGKYIFPAGQDPSEKFPPDDPRNTYFTAEEDDTIKCPKCRSSQVTANNKGFGLGKAAVGGLLLGPVGLLGGLIGSKKVMITCLKCGHRWQPGG